MSDKILPNLLDFLLEPNYLVVNGRRIKTMGCREKIEKYKHFIFEDENNE